MMLGTSVPMIAVPMKLDGVEPPSYAHNGDAGADVTSKETVTLRPHETRLVSTGVSIAMPPQYFCMLVPRSSIATRLGVTLANSPGIIDSTYRGEIKAALHNMTDHDVTIEAGTRVAQLIMMEYVTMLPSVTSDLDETSRGTEGFGSTGM